MCNQNLRRISRLISVYSVDSVLAEQFRQGFFFKADDDLFAFAKDWAAKQIRFGDDEFNQFFACGKLFGKAALFVNRVACVQKRRNRIVTKNGFDLFGGQRLFGVIAFGDLVGVCQVAQETPGVAASRSGAFVEEVHLILEFEFWILDSELKIQNPKLFSLRCGQ